jgi:hypothetical protein
MGIFVAFAALGGYEMAVRSIPELIDERRHKIKTLEDMAERAKAEGDRNFTPDEQASMDALDGEIKQLTTEIDDREAHEVRTLPR